MANFKLTSRACIALAIILAVHGANVPNRPKPASPSLGSVILPSLGGWNAPPPTTTPPPETTTPGWSPPPETTTTPGWSPPPETTTTPGWSPPPEPVTPGWAPTPGWASPPGPISIELSGASEVAGAGEAGGSHGSSLSVTGDAQNPAIVSLQTGSSASLGQGTGTQQISNINSSGASDTLQTQDAYNYGDATDYLSASAAGNSIDAVQGGASFVAGQGWIGQGGLTAHTNPIVPVGGWVPV